MDVNPNQMKKQQVVSAGSDTGGGDDAGFGDAGGGEEVDVEVDDTTDVEIEA